MNRTELKRKKKKDSNRERTERKKEGNKDRTNHPQKKKKKKDKNNKTNQKTPYLNPGAETRQLRSPTWQLSKMRKCRHSGAMGFKPDQVCEPFVCESEQHSLGSLSSFAGRKRRPAVT